MKTYEQRQQLMEQVNQMGITISMGKYQYPAKVAGAKLDFPFIWARLEDGHDIECEITWQQVEKMSKGTITTIRKS